MTRKTCVIAAVAALLVGAASVASANLYWLRFRVGSVSRLEMHGTLLPMTTYTVRDEQNPNVCLFVLRDDRTQQFTTTTIDAESCR